MVYFDDILIDNNNLEEHIKHLKNVLVVLRKQYLYVDMKNYDFCMKKKMFLGYLFKEKRLCIPNCSILKFLIHKAHGGKLMGHFEIAKTLDILYKHFYLPKMKRDVQRIFYRCITCRKVKSIVLSHDLYSLANA